MATNCAFADDGSSKLQGDTLKKAVSGKTVHLATPLGTLPIRFRMNGTMSGTAGEMAAYTGVHRRQRALVGEFGETFASAGKLGLTARSTASAFARKARSCTGYATMD
jgi:hypothetical protein